MKKLFLILLLFTTTLVYADIDVTGKFAPKGGGFTGLIDGNQALDENTTAGNIGISDGTSYISTAPHAGTDITADLEEETHASEHAVSGADTVFPADPNADKYLMWDDVPGQLSWEDAGGAGATAWDDIGNPDANDEIDFGSYVIELNVVNFQIGDGGANFVDFNGTPLMSFQGNADIDLPNNSVDATDVNFNYATSVSEGGVATTATALAANGTNCGAGSYPLGVDASGASELCTDATTEINSVVNGLGGTDLTCAAQSCDVDAGVMRDAEWTSATTAAEGKVELATIAETDTGTDTARVVTPDGLAGSIHGEKPIYVKAIPYDEALAVGDNLVHVVIGDALNGMDLVDVDCCVYTASTSGLPSIDVYNNTDTVDMLSTNITIDANEKCSYTAVTAPVINGATDDVATGDDIRIDVDVIGTGTKGLDCYLIFQTP